MCLESLLELVDTLIRHTETSGGFRSGDRIMPVEAGTGHEYVETFVVLAGDQFNVLRNSIVKARCCLSIDRGAEIVETVEQELSICGSPGSGDVVHGLVASGQVFTESWILVPDPCRPGFSCNTLELKLNASTQICLSVVSADGSMSDRTDVRDRHGSRIGPSSDLCDCQCVESCRIVVQAVTSQHRLGSGREWQCLGVEVVGPACVEDACAAHRINSTRLFRDVHHPESVGHTETIPITKVER
jgi:hypothetical protein